jgi:undecaprenyl-diphosphatase
MRSWVRTNVAEMFEALLAADRALGLWLAAHLEHPAITSLMIALTVIGAKGGVWLALGFVTWLIAPARRMRVWRLLLALGLAGLLVDQITKPIVGRVRPWVDHSGYRDFGRRPTSPSFPSGHAATAAAGALALTRIWPAAAVPAWTLAALIALSRIALGVHFPSDVVAGFLLGLLSASFVCARPPTHAALDTPIVGARKAVL